MSSSNWRQPRDDRGSCSSETTNKSTTPPPEYSSLEMIDNPGTGSNNTPSQENPQEQLEIDLENGELPSPKPSSSWYKKIYNGIPVEKICSHITLKSIGSVVGLAILGFLGLSFIVVGVVLVWDLVVYVIVNRGKVCTKTD
ncbi:hypothetical protein V500_06118 [Pseudogymnoascus sp. VKM F-4518 (FW-2643)]|nr:hypothetical protein V500_06118 [Pseudogymnoascus sp. VKM F-4518 (FW-2643)]